MSDSRPPIDLSLIICCYNEEEILEQNFRSVVEFLDRPRLNYELIIVEDCSQDNTLSIIRRLLEEYAGWPVKTIFHQRNLGRGATVRDGIRIAEGKVAGFLDIDLEIQESYILPCVIPILNGFFDIVTGYRIYKLHPNPYTLSRHILSHGYRRIIRSLLRTNLKDTETGYKFFDRARILPLLELAKNDHWFWDTEIMLISEHLGLRIREIPCLFMRNPQKTSTVKVFRDAADYLRQALRFRKRLRSIRPGGGAER